MVKGKPEIDRELCKGCGLCLEACPRKILVLDTRANRQGVYPALCREPEQCTACKFCAIACPETAIRIYRVRGEEK